MSDFDFLKDFAQNFDQPRSDEPSESNWAKLSAALDAQSLRNRRKRGVLLWVWPLAAGAAMLMMGLALWQTRQQADKLRMEVEQLKIALSAPKAIARTDTTVHHYSIIHRDTIFRTVVISQKVANVIAQNGNAGQAVLNTTIQGGQIPANTIQSTPIAQKEKAVAGEAPRPWTTLAALPMFHIQPVSSKGKKHPADLSDIPLEPVAVQAHVPVTRRLKSTDFSLGATGGLLFPTETLESTPLNGYTVGVSGQMALSDHWQLATGIELGWTSFKVRASGLDNANLPILTPPTPNDVLNYALVRQPLWDFSLGARYVFSPGRRLRPFLSAAWVCEQSLEQTLEYEFKNTLTKEYTYVQVPRNESDFNAQGIQLGLGAGYQFSRRVTFQLQGYYQHQYNSAFPPLFERWGIQTGLLYHF